MCKNDIAKNVILKSEYEGVEIKKSDSLPIFSSVDLYIGTGVPKINFFKIPDLVEFLNNAKIIKWKLFEFRFGQLWWISFRFK